MAYTKAHFDLSAPAGQFGFAKSLGLENIGVNIHVFARGEGFDFFHNHREQEEVYLCLQGSADLEIAGEAPERVHLETGDIVRVDAQTLRAVGNRSSDRAVVLIAGACPHPYPSGIGHHDVIADVLVVRGRGETGFTLPAYLSAKSENDDPGDC